MDWFTSLPTWLLVVGSLALSIVVATAGRIAVLAVVPAAERDSVHGVASPLCPPSAQPSP